MTSSSSAKSTKPEKPTAEDLITESLGLHRQTLQHINQLKPQIADHVPRIDGVADQVSRVQSDLTALMSKSLDTKPLEARVKALEALVARQTVSLLFLQWLGIGSMVIAVLILIRVLVR